MADKALTDPAAMFGAFLNTAKPEKVNPAAIGASIVKGAIMPVSDPYAGLQARISAVDDNNKAPAPAPAFNPAADLLRRLYGL
jgi:hypothetical protein